MNDEEFLSNFIENLKTWRKSIEEVRPKIYKKDVRLVIKNIKNKRCPENVFCNLIPDKFCFDNCQYCLPYEEEQGIHYANHWQDIYKAMVEIVEEEFKDVLEKR